MLCVARTFTQKEQGRTWFALFLFASCVSVAPVHAVPDLWALSATTDVPSPWPVATPTPGPTPVPLSAVSGSVTEDETGDGVGNAGLSGVTLTLSNKSDGAVIGTVLTDSSGNYSFENLPPGDYVIVQTNLGGYVDVSDTSGNPVDSTIHVSVIAGQNAPGNDFVDKRLGSISGEVMEDSDYDGIGDKPLPGVTVKLMSLGQLIGTKVTDSSGAYKFESLPNSKYFVVQKNLPGYIDVSDTQGKKLDSRIRHRTSSDTITPRAFSDTRHLSNTRHT